MQTVSSSSRACPASDAGRESRFTAFNLVCRLCLKLLWNPEFETAWDTLSGSSLFCCPQPRSLPSVCEILSAYRVCEILIQTFQQSIVAGALTSKWFSADTVINAPSRCLVWLPHPWDNRAWRLSFVVCYTSVISPQYFQKPLLWGSQGLPGSVNQNQHPGISKISWHSLSAHSQPPGLYPIGNIGWESHSI